MNRSYSKIRHIEKSNLVLENRSFGRKPLLEYDFDDEKMGTAQEELNSIAPDINALMPELNLSSVKEAAKICPQI